MSEDQLEDFAKHRKKGSAEILTLAGILLGIILIIAVFQCCAANAQVILTDEITVSATPIAVGHPQGRCILDISPHADAANVIYCGPCSLPPTQWQEVSATVPKSFGIIYHGTCTASRPICCYSRAEDVTVSVTEEGGMYYSTPTPVDTATPVDTPTAAPTVTPVDTPTATPAATATAT